MRAVRVTLAFGKLLHSGFYDIISHRNTHTRGNIMSLEQAIGTTGFGVILFCIASWFIITCIFGMIMKHFVREAIKEALDDCGLSKRKTDNTW